MPLLWEEINGVSVGITVPCSMPFPPSQDLSTLSFSHELCVHYYSAVFIFLTVLLAAHCMDDNDGLERDYGVAV